MSSACQSDGQAVPPIPRDTKAVIWAVRTNGAWRLEAFEVPTAGGIRFTERLPAGTELAVLAYRDSLFDLGIEVGPVEPIGQSGSRALPWPQEVLTAQTSGDARLTWAVSAGLPAGLEAFRIPAIDPVACIDAGGCMTDVSTEARCRQVCEVSPVLPPTPAAAPNFAVCPEGWVRTGTTTDVVRPCAPPAARPAPCPPGQYQPVGAADCRPLGADCATRFGMPPPGTETVYVDAAAGPAGDGTASTPYRTIVDALDESGRPVAVLVAGGIYPETLVITDEVSIIGACAADVRIGTDGVGARINAGQATLRDVTFDGAVIVADGIAEFEAVDVAEVEGGQALGRGAMTVQAGSVRLVRTRLRSYRVGLRANSSVELSDVVLVGQEQGLSVGASAEVVADRLRIRNGDQGIRVVDNGQLTADQVVIEAGGMGLTAAGPGARASIRDLVVRDLEGQGALRTLQGQLELERVLVHDVSEFGAVVQADDLSVVDGVIRDVRGAATGGNGWGVRIVGGRFSGTRVRIEQVGHLGLWAEGRGATGQLRDAVIQDVPVVPMNSAAPGGAYAAEGGILDFERVEIRRVIRAGISTEADLEAATVTATDLIIEDIFSRPGGTKGHGIIIDDGTQMLVERARIARTRAFGIEVRDGSTLADLCDVVVTDTATASCDSNDCRLGNGVGIAVSAGARLDLRQFEVRRNTDVGIRVDATLGVEVADGVVQGNRIGLWVSDPALDLGGVVDRVRFENNETDLVATR